MTTTSAAFAGFILVVVFVYYLLPLRGQNVWLLFASYVFVISWAWPFAAVLFTVTLVNYAIGRLVGAQPGRRGTLLRLGIAFNVATLIHFKNAAFYLPQLLALVAGLGLPTQSPGLQFLIPLGVSYYSLQAISYLVDVHRGLLPPAVSLVDFSLYMAYFPKLVAGPIERARTFLPKLAQSRIVDNEALARSATLIVVGLVRKVVVADSLTELIPLNAFFLPDNVSSPELAFYLLAYAFALYNDFAGYTSIARGVSGLFGIELSSNFLQPYFSRTFTEFWNRWHISLSHWLRDYVYFPLSRVLARRYPNRRHVVNIVAPPLVTMLVSAAWHATWLHKTVFLWGLLHALYLVGERRIWLKRPLKPPDHWPRYQQFLGALIVFTLTTLAWVPFREGSGFSQVMAGWLRLVDPRGWVMPDIRILLIVFLAVWLDWLQWRQQDEVVFIRWPLLARATALAIAITAIIVNLSATGSVPFVYQAF
jgi:alginate O-acetyltransferase complex protein AlgI